MKTWHNVHIAVVANPSGNAFAVIATVFIHASGIVPARIVEPRVVALVNIVTVFPIISSGAIAQITVSFY